MSDILEELNSLKRKRTALIGEIGVAREAAGKLKGLVARQAAIDKVIALLDPPEPKPRAKKGAASGIIASILNEKPEMPDDAVLALALEQPNPPSRSALRKALREHRPVTGEGTEVPR